MNDKEYYTPDISDLFVGYEFEILKPHKYSFEVLKENFKDRKWAKERLVSGTHLDELSNFYFYEDSIRTKYLDKEDIESFGFSTPPYTDGYLTDYYKFLKDNTEVNLWILKDNNIQIRIDYDTVFKGRCKSKNELKKILKWTGIN